MALNFRVRWVPLIAALAAASVGIALGDWQTRRAQEKEAIEARLSVRETEAPVQLSAYAGDPAELEFRRVLMRGEFVSGWNVFLDNRPYAGAAGFYVAAPFRLEHDNSHVLVLRGWTPRNIAERTRIQEIPTPDGSIEIEGMVRMHIGRIMQLGDPEPLRPGAIVQNLVIEELGRAGGWTMRPFVVEQLSDTGDGLVRDWLRPSTGADKHRGYAFQWYGLAAAALVFFFVTGFRRGPK